MACGFWLKYSTVHYILGLRKKRLKNDCKGLWKKDAHTRDKLIKRRLGFWLCVIVPVASPVSPLNIISTCPSIWKQLFKAYCAMQTAISTTFYFQSWWETYGPCFSDRDAATCVPPVCLFRRHMPHKSQSIHLTMNQTSSVWFRGLI